MLRVALCVVASGVAAWAVSGCGDDLPATWCADHVVAYCGGLPGDAKRDAICKDGFVGECGGITCLPGTQCFAE